MLNRKQEAKLPTHDSLEELCKMFADFFTEKIQKIRQTLADVPKDSGVYSNSSTSIMDELEPATEDKVRN